MNVKILSQRDQRWSNIKLGTSPVNIGGYGCAITALAMMLNEIKETEVYTPDLMNCILNSRGGYVNQNLLNFAKVPEIFGGLVYNGRIDCPNTKAPINEVTSRLQTGWPVIIYVDASLKQPGLQQHFVLAIGELEGGIQIADPWYGDITSLSPRYGKNDEISICGIIKLDARMI